MFYLHGQVYLLITKNRTFKWYIRDIFECMSLCVYPVVPLKSKTDTNVTASICTSLLHQETSPRPDNNYQRITQIARERESEKKLNCTDGTITPNVTNYGQFLGLLRSQQNTWLLKADIGPNGFLKDWTNTICFPESFISHNLVGLTCPVRGPL